MARIVVLDRDPEGNATRRAFRQYFDEHVDERSILESTGVIAQRDCSPCVFPIQEKDCRCWESEHRWTARAPELKCEAVGARGQLTEDLSLTDDPVRRLN